ncbi:enediyne biosynthesis protein UnbU [Sphingomonas sp. MMS12-HWE2-04]|uniref:enediyne biosynthesis protein UnbU n=1 Tax=Sphingomonas sp. MMS12-HWE2-04 TaxID=3234199 RepID=UPI00384B39A0
MNAPEKIAPPIDVAPAIGVIARREKALMRFATAITVLNILGHLWLGFEASWITPFVALAAAYSTEVAGEVAMARSLGRTPRFLGGGFKGLVMFMLSAHITGLAVSMLLYAAEQLWAVAFAASAAVASKYLFRMPVGPNGASRHFLNPSNFGIALTLVLFPTIGISAPYQFAENITGAIDWLLPLVIVTTGSMINIKLTRRLPLIGAWLAGFAAQAAIRAAIFGTPLAAGLAPMTGFAFVLFTFYMVTDPATTPESARNQRFFGAAVAFTYGLLMMAHIVFGLFFALVIVTGVRGIFLTLVEWQRRWSARQILATSAPVYAE